MNDKLYLCLLILAVLYNICKTNPVETKKALILSIMYIINVVINCSCSSDYDLKLIFSKKINIVLKRRNSFLITY